MALQKIPPAEVLWRVRDRSEELFTSGWPEQFAPQSDKTFSVPAALISLALTVIQHSATQRFALLYQLLWRLRIEHHLLHVSTDTLVSQLQAMAKAVHRDQHKMKAFVRFREFGRDPKSHYLAWFEPAHHIVEATAPFFADRFADMDWSILTPDRCAHWNGRLLTFSAGASKSDTITSDPLEELWRTYYRNIFNPARLKTKTMQKEMPKKYWRNLPEASLIEPLIAGAARSAQSMIDRMPPEPRPQRGRAMPKSLASSVGNNLEALRAEASDCRACPLWHDATQTVFGEGSANASIMFVGEQPGDKEDLAGKPFVGPAGQVFDRALKDAGIARVQTYVTNAVKHFKFEPRGKRRLHQRPNTSEIKACRWWYERERAIVKPVLIVAMGATAAQSVFGKVSTIGKMRGKFIALDENTKALVTVHPSYLLRLPDEDARSREYRLFVEDLKLAASLLDTNGEAA